MCNQCVTQYCHHMQWLMVTFQPQADLLPQPSTPDGLITFHCSQVHLKFSYGGFILHLGKHPVPPNTMYCQVAPNSGYKSKSICTIPNLMIKLWSCDDQDCHHDSQTIWLFEVPSVKVTLMLWTNCRPMSTMNPIYWSLEKFSLNKQFCTAHQVQINPSCRGCGGHNWCQRRSGQRMCKHILRWSSTSICGSLSHLSNFMCGFTNLVLQRLI